jgi:hypothetical protein
MGAVSAFLLREVRGGSAVSDAMTRAPGAPFNRFLVQMVQAGQSTGRLEEALDQAYRYMDRYREFRSNLVARWEYTPGSSLFLVWSQGRTGLGSDPTRSLGGRWGDLWRWRQGAPLRIRTLTAKTLDLRLLRL